MFLSVKLRVTFNAVQLRSLEKHIYVTNEPAAYSDVGKCLIEHCCVKYRKENSVELKR
jgi:hypothetical protein